MLCEDIIKFLERDDFNMEMPPSVYEAINEMFQCNSFVEHLACFKQFYEELKDCLLLYFRNIQHVHWRNL